MHDCFASARTESGIELVAVVEGEIVAREGLAAVFVDSLEDLVASRVAETGEKRGEFPEGRGVGTVFEDYFVEAGEGGDFAGVAHEAFGGCVDGVEDGEFGDAGGAWGVVS